MAENIKFMKVSSSGQKYNNVYKDLYQVFTKNTLEIRNDDDDTLLLF